MASRLEDAFDVREKVLLVCADLHNVGDLALLLQNLELARSDGRRKFVRRWGRPPPVVEAQVAAAGGELFSGRDALEILHAAWRADCLIGGGQLVRDNASIPSLVSLLLCTVISRASGGKVSTRGLGVSRIRSAARRLLWRAVLSTCNEIVVRDEASAAHVRDLGVRRRVVIRADMAFAPTSLHARRAAPTEPTTPVLVIAPCIDVGEGRSIDGAAFASLIPALREATPGIKLRFVCHDPRPSMDVAAANSLATSHHLEGAAILDGYELGALLDEYARASVVVTNRLHALIFSMILGRPAIAIDDGDPKLHAICEAFRIPAIARNSQPSRTELRSVIEAATGFDREARTRTLRDLGRLALGEA